MTRISDDFRGNVEQSTVMPPGDKDKVEEKAKAQSRGGNDASVTMEAPPPSSSGSSSIPVELVPPPTTNPNLVMAQVQSLQSKLSTNQMDSSSNQISSNRVKMDKAIKEYNDKLQKEQDAESKAHSKNLINEIVDGIEDAAMAIGGAVLCAIPGAQAAGIALLATDAINISDQVVTGAFGNKPLLTGEAAKVFGYVAMGATVVVGVATMGAGLAASGAAVAADAAGETAEGIEMVDMASQAGGDAAEMGSDVAGQTVKVGDEIGDASEEIGDASEEVGDASEGGSDDSGNDQEIEMTERNVARARMEQQFEKGFSEDVVEDSGSGGDGSGDDSSSSVPRRDLAIAGMKIGAGAVKGILGMVAAAGGITKGVNTIEIGKAQADAQNYEADAEAAQKDIHTASLDMQAAIGHLQNDLQQYEAVSKDLTGVIMGYAQVQTDTAVQGYA